MKLVSINELSRLTGHTRETCARRLEGVEPQPGPNRSKLYNSELALPLVMGISAAEDGDPTTLAEANRRLAIARTKQVEHETKKSQDKWVPIEEVIQVNGEIWDGMRKIIIARDGKLMDMETINQLLEELRKMDIGAKRIQEEL
jgi:hypothetical protein